MKIKSGYSVFNRIAFSLVKRLRLHGLLLLCFAVITLKAQTIQYPKQFYSLKTYGHKAAFLKKAIGDSVKVKSYKIVPIWCHTTLDLISKTDTDTLSPILYRYLGDAYDGVSNDSAAYYYRLSLSRYKNITLHNKLYLQQSLVYTFTALNNRDSILFYVQALENTVAKFPESASKRKGLNTIASTYSDLSKYNKAIKNFREVITQSLKANDSSALLNALVNIGNAYNKTGNEKMAIFYTRQAIPYLKNDWVDEMITYSNLSDYYSNIKNIDSSRYFLAKAEEQALEGKDVDAIYQMTIPRAALFINEKKYNEAEHLLANGLIYFTKQEPSLPLINCFLLYATVDTLQNKFEQSEAHLLSLYSILKATNQSAFLAENLKLLSAVNAHMKDYKDAFKYQKLMIAINDSIKSEKLGNSFAELQTEYQTYKKQEQISMLEKEGVIKDLELHDAFKNKTLYIIFTLVLLLAFAGILHFRNLRNKTALQKVKAELEMKALRSQMNPHFIFNSLNSIQKYIWENRQEDASEYLTKFARLIRTVLENSLHPSVKLTEELSALRLYIEMEHRRNNQKFDYSITVAENIDADHVNIPPLLLQPYVENAIWHGLSQKEERGTLHISIKKENDNLICTIDDDGVGRGRSSEIKMGKMHGKTSLAMNISSQRVEWLKKDKGMNASVNVFDKYNNNNEAEGTTVLLTLPLNS